MSKVRVGILRGGPSEEFEVSLNTGRAVLNGINREVFDPVDIVITKSGEWLIDGYERYPEKIIPTLDVIFLALHGTYGEDGTVQRMLDRYSVPYTGSKAYSSAIAMHKALTKDHLKELNITMAPHRVITQDSLRNIHQTATSISEMFGPQYVIKPVSSGSSKGIVIVHNIGELSQALKKSLEIYPEVLVEKRIIGREGTCGVVENYRSRSLYALPPIEIIPPQKSEFFDSEVKYNGETKEICPSSFSRKIKDDMERISMEVHSALGLSQYSRSDFMVDGDTVYFLEVNTLPGLTEESLFPKAIAAVGDTYTNFLTHLLTESMSVKR